MGIEERFSTGEVAQPFWRALAEGRLVLPRCGRCAEVFFFPRRWCPCCWSEDVGWIDASGRGTVYARTEVHLPFPGIHEADLPVVELLVDLDEGARIPGRAHPDSRDVQIGDRVRIAFARDPGEEVPSFVRAD
jgi:uncharacterized OB-fold protein